MTTSSLSDSPSVRQKPALPWLAFATGVLVSALVAAPLGYVASAGLTLSSGTAPLLPVESDETDVTRAAHVYPGGVPVPDFQTFGFAPNGARAVADTNGRAVELLYKSAFGRNLSLFVVPRSVPTIDRILSDSGNRLTVLLRDDLHSYVVSGNVEAATVLAVWKYLDQRLNGIASR